MAEYRFRVVWEEDENIERTILIKSNQTFLHFFTVLTNSLKLKNKNVSASFFTSNDYWEKLQEITLRKEDIQSNEKLMKDTKIASLIEHPHQKFTFVYDSELQLTFLIELIKIQPDKENEKEYPKVISSKGDIPKRRKTKKKPPLNNDINTLTHSNALSDDEIDKIIYSNMMNANITEEDILSGKLEHLFKELSKNKTHNDDEEEDEDEFEDEFFNEDEDRIDNDDFHQDGYHDEYEN